MPPWADPEVLAKDDMWRKPGDVIVAGIPFSSGSVWIHHLVHQIKTHGARVDFNDVNTVAPWVDFVSYPTQSLAERIEIIAGSKSRVFKTYQAPPKLTVHNDTKYVVIFRNPVALVEGSFYFFEGIDPSFRKMWGGFPPEVNATGFGDFALKEMAPAYSRIGAINEFMVPFLRGWWPYRGYKNVHFIHLGDGVDVDTLATFLGEELTGAEKAVIAERTSTTWMREHADLFDMRNWFKSLHQRGYVPITRAVVPSEERSVRPFKLTLQQSTSVISRFNIHTGMCVGNWLRTGGPIPLDCDLEDPGLTFT